MTPSRATSCPEHLQRDIPARGWEPWGGAGCWGHRPCPVPSAVLLRWPSDPRREREGLQGVLGPRCPCEGRARGASPKASAPDRSGVSYLPPAPGVRLARALLASAAPGPMRVTTLGSLKMKTQSCCAGSRESGRGCTDDCVNPSPAAGCRLLPSPSSSSSSSSHRLPAGDGDAVPCALIPSLRETGRGHRAPWLAAPVGSRRRSRDPAGMFWPGWGFTRPGGLWKTLPEPRTKPKGTERVSSLSLPALPIPVIREERVMPGSWKGDGTLLTLSPPAAQGHV